MRPFALLCSLGILLLVLAPPAEATNGLKLTAYGPRAAGRGGVDYAYADDGIGPATNPAGMAFVYGNRLDQNWAVIFPKVTWTNSFGSFDNEARVFVPLPAYSFGVFIDPEKDWEIAPIFDIGSWGLEPDEAASETRPQGPPDDAELAPLTDLDLYGSRLRIGLGVFPLTGAKIKMADVRTAGISAPVNWETDVLSLMITPSLAYRFNEHFSFGLAFQVRHTRFELDGGIAQPSSVLRDDFEFANSILNVNPQILTVADIDDGVSDTERNNGQWGFSFRAGIQFRSRYVSAGLVYQDRTYSSDILGRATVDSSDEINNLTQGNPALLQIVDPLINPALGFTSVYDVRIQRFEFPRMFGAGIAINPHERFSVGLDYTFIMWEEVMRVFRARLSNGSNPNLDILTSPTINVRVPLRFRNQHVIAVGATVLALRGDDIVEGVPSYELLLRAGYNYSKNPTPGETTLPQQPTIAEHHVTGGFTLRWGPLVEFNFGVEYALPTTLKSGNHIGNFTLGNSEQELSILFLHFGLGVNF